MNIVDLVIIILLISSMVRGLDIGSIRQILSAAGFFEGLLLGVLLEPQIVRYAHTTASRSWLTLIVTLGLALIFLAIGEYVGIRLKFKLQYHHHQADMADRFFGLAVGAATLLFTVWLLAGILINLPFPSVQSKIRGSAIIALLDETLPSAPRLIDDFSRVIDPNGFPKVFTGNEPTPLNQNTPLPPLGELTAAVTKDRPSVVMIEGNGCGGVVEGSGFVVSPGLVATNAHVIAGVRHPFVLTQDNSQLAATPIWFDPKLDFAVLRVTGLAASPLKVQDSNVNDGTDAAILGFPGGGNFNVSPAVVLDDFTALGRNIYDQGNTVRDVYSIKGTVIPGNSGGPLVAANGSVIGVVFAESTQYNQVGYALTTPQVVTEINQAEKAIEPVDTGQCAE
jgi:S1-C subfamily serine protease